MDSPRFEGLPLEGATGFLNITPLTDIRRENYYFLSNDKVDLSPLRFKKENATVVGVATADSFHVLHAIRERGTGLKRIVAFDRNEAQLLHFKTVRDDILNSTSRVDFIERLFCVDLNPDLVNFLNRFQASGPSNILPGETRGAGGVEEERFVWSNAAFDETKFVAKYGLKAQRTDCGLLIQSKTLTGRDDCLATVLCLERRLLNKDVFSIRYGRGFLRDEAAFSSLRHLLLNTPTYIIRMDVTKDLDSLLRYLRYEPVVLWTSNIFNRPFVERFPELRALAAEVSKLASKTNGFPQMDLTALYDLRDRSSLKVRPRSRLRSCLMNPHYKTFRKIVSLIEEGESIEVVNEPKWISQDQGISKLPRTEYCLAGDFVDREDIRKRQNIILHSLISHGVDKNEFEHVFRKALKLGSKVLVLEHNPRSPELRRMRLPDIPRYIDDLKTPYIRHSVSGRWFPRRNFIYEFSSRGAD